MAHPTFYRTTRIGGLTIFYREAGQRVSRLYARTTRAGSREFHASSARRTFWMALSRVNGGTGGRVSMAFLSSSMITALASVGLALFQRRAATRSTTTARARFPLDSSDAWVAKREGSQ